MVSRICPRFSTFLATDKGFSKRILDKLGQEVNETTIPIFATEVGGSALSVLLAPYAYSSRRPFGSGMGSLNSRAVSNHNSIA